MSDERFTVADNVHAIDIDDRLIPVEKYALRITDKSLAEDVPMWRGLWEDAVVRAGAEVVSEPTITRYEDPNELIHGRRPECWIVAGRVIRR